MTINSAVLRNDYIGTGTTGPFPYGFKIFAASDMVVKSRNLLGAETTLAYPTDYSITGVGSESGGNVTLTVALTTGWALALFPTIVFNQTMDLDQMSAGYLPALEDRADRLCRADQVLQRTLDRCIKVPESETSTPVLPAKELRANTTAVFDANGNMTAGSGLTGTTVSAAMIPVVTASTTAAGRTAMGIDTAIATSVSAAVTAHEALSNPHPTYATDADLAAHVAAVDPHTVYSLDSDLTTHVNATSPHPNNVCGAYVTNTATASNTCTLTLAAGTWRVDAVSHNTTGAAANQVVTVGSCYVTIGTGILYQQSQATNTSDTYYYSNLFSLASTTLTWDCTAIGAYDMQMLGVRLK